MQDPVLRDLTLTSLTPIIFAGNDSVYSSKAVHLLKNNKNQGSIVRKPSVKLDFIFIAFN